MQRGRVDQDLASLADMSRLFRRFRPGTRLHCVGGTIVCPSYVLPVSFPCPSSLSVYVLPIPFHVLVHRPQPAPLAGHERFGLHFDVVVSSCAAPRRTATTVHDAAAHVAGVAPPQECAQARRGYVLERGRMARTTDCRGWSGADVWPMGPLEAGDGRAVLARRWRCDEATMAWR